MSDNLPELSVNTDTLVPATRVQPGDLLNLKDSHVLTRCPCESCDIAKGFADDGEFFEVEYSGPAEFLYELGAFYSPGTWVIVTDKYAFAVEPTMFLPVKAFSEAL